MGSIVKALSVLSLALERTVGMRVLVPIVQTIVTETTSADFLALDRGVGVSALEKSVRLFVLAITVARIVWVPIVPIIALVNSVALSAKDLVVPIIALLMTVLLNVRTTIAGSTV